MAKSVKMSKFPKNEIKEKLMQRLGVALEGNPNGPLKPSLKEDQSPVTEIDLFISELVKNEVKSTFGEINFLSEEGLEEELLSLEFPTVILDPIDGTRELVTGKAECALSMALMNSSLIADKNNKAWIYNPFTGFDLSTDDIFYPRFNKSNQPFLGLVSRSEFKKGYFDKFLSMNPNVTLSPRGSIAYKLGLLAAGSCDFVISLSPKNIWDIAAGTILCQQRGMKLYQEGKEVKDLSDLLIKGKLIWAYPEVHDFIWDCVSKMK